MCGICGKAVLDGPPVGLDLVREMCAVLAHRGPDMEGVWSSHCGRSGSGPWMALGHRRLSIIDLTGAGRQPMRNEDGSLWLVFNGEIYNHEALRARLSARGHRFISRTDAEVVLHLYEEMGTGLLPELRGMFAFGVADVPRGRLFLARDRLGQKPLVYARIGKDLVFASEIKALWKDPGLCPEVNPEAIHHYLTLQYVPTPMTAFRGVEKLPPAHFLTWQNGEVRLQQYWKLRWDPMIHERKVQPLQAVLDQLDEAVRLRMISDVPIGAFLSGGLDSSAVVALMARHSRTPVRTMTVGFAGAENDERPFGRMISEWFGTSHVDVEVRPEVKEDLGKIAWHFDEPFGDASAVPTFYLSKAMRGRAKVALSGEGGDESFAGYDRHRAIIWYRRYASIPPVLRDRLVPGALERLPIRGWSRNHWIHRMRLFVRPGELSPARRYGQWLSHFTPAERDWICTRGFAEEMKGRDSLATIERRFREVPAGPPLHGVLNADLHTYLPDDLLVKLDRASMAHGLEVRAPFLDHVLVELAASIPPSWKIRRWKGKYVLKTSLRGLLPPQILSRRKVGFSPPIARWIQTDLRDMVQDLLMDRTARRRGYFRPERVWEIIQEHMAGVRNRHYQIWNLLMLELWHRIHVDGGGRARP